MTATTYGEIPAPMLAYHRRECTLMARRLTALTEQPLSDRKEAQADYLRLMRDPATCGERVEWILTGNYGYAERQEALAIRSAGKRANRTAAMGQLLAALECSCPQREAAAAWKQLTATEAEAVGAAILTAMDAPEEE